MELSQLRCLKKIFCFLFMKKLGFQKVSERFMFCRFDSWLFQVSCLSVFYSSYLQTTCKNPKPILWKKHHQTTFKLQGMFISTLFTIWVTFYDWQQIVEFTIQSLFKVWKRRYLFYQRHWVWVACGATSLPMCYICKLRLRDIQWKVSKTCFEYSYSNPYSWNILSLLKYGNYSWVNPSAFSSCSSLKTTFK